MNFETICVSPEDELNFRAAVRALQEGEVVGMPTETVYGLGADARNPEAVKKIYEAKGRPSDNPLIVHVSNKDMIHSLVSEIKIRRLYLYTLYAFVIAPVHPFIAVFHQFPEREIITLKDQVVF